MRVTGDRGQTNIDFIIAIAVFLIAFTFVLGFMPKLFAPYADEEKPIVASRVESALIDSILTQSNREPGVLNATTTSTYDNKIMSDVRDEVGVGNRYQLNVTIRDTSGGLILDIGPNPPQNSATVAASHRAVLLNDDPHVLKVRVW